MTFSVVIPTLQRVAGTAALVEDLTASPHVGEILIVNNAGQPLPYVSPKVRELRQPTNIFVNPAWNLGAASAVHDLLCFANDDIRFDVSLLGPAQRLLRLPVGILGPGEDVFTGHIGPAQQPDRRGRLRLRPVYRRTNGFGTLMLMRRTSFVPIPETLKVWFGDDFLFHRQRHRNVVFGGVPIHTTMSSTSSSPAFLAMAEAESEAYIRLGMGDYERRFRRDLQVIRPLHRAARRASGRP